MYWDLSDVVCITVIRELGKFFNKPFQLWFGEFIHGVMEEAYVIYQSSIQAGSVNLPP